MKKNKKPESRAMWRSVATLLLGLVLTACAGPGGHPKDPLEPINRATFRFNETADRYVMRPAAEVYDSCAAAGQGGRRQFLRQPCRRVDRRE
jgi:hypothetical protein